MAIHNSQIGYLFNGEMILSSSLIDDKHLENVCKVLLNRGVFFIVEPGRELIP